MYRTLLYGVLGPVSFVNVYWLFVHLPKKEQGFSYLACLVVVLFFPLMKGNFHLINGGKLSFFLFKLILDFYIFKS